MTLKIGVLGSTKGTDLQAIIDAVERGELDAEIACVVSDREDAYILERANQHGIDSLFIEYEGKKRSLFDKAVAKEFEKRGVDLVILIGFMRIVSKWLCGHYKDKMMNVHPSLLPLFAGGMDTNVHEEVIDMGLKVTGCTLHFVTPKVDSGPIIMQKPVEVEWSDTPDSLKKKVQAAEQEVLIKAIRKFGEGKIKIEGNKVKVEG